MAVAKDCKQHQQQHLLVMEVKVLSARSLKGPSTLFSGRLRPYVALSPAAASDLSRELDKPPSLPSASAKGGGSGVLYRTRVDERGEENPTWGDTVHVPLDPSFLLPATGGAIHLLVLSQRRLPGPARVGWCRIPACDVVDGLRQPGSVRRLSYALRSCSHGGRGHGVVDVAVRLVGPAASAVPPPAMAPEPVQVQGVPPVSGWAAGEVAVGIPVGAYALAGMTTGRKERVGAVGGARSLGCCGERRPGAGMLTMALT